MAGSHQDRLQAASMPRIPPSVDSTVATPHPPVPPAPPVLPTPPASATAAHVRRHAAEDGFNLSLAGTAHSPSVVPRLCRFALAYHRLAHRSLTCRLRACRLAGGMHRNRHTQGSWPLCPEPHAARTW